jgi:hypothetical protein
MTIDLPDETALRSTLANGLTRDDRWTTYSRWIGAVIGEIAATKYPYNDTVQREVEKRLGIARQPDDQSTLSILVYNAQGYSRDERQRTEGWSELSEAMIDTALAQDCKVEVLMESIMGNVAKVLTPRRGADGVGRLFKPRCRAQSLRVSGQPARLCA